MPKFSKTAPSDSHVVTEDRFKILPVTSRISIRDFVAKHGITFAPGRGKPHKIFPHTCVQAHSISNKLYKFLLKYNTISNSKYCQ